MVSRSESPLTSAMFVISGAEKQWHQILNFALIARSRSSYHSIFRSGCRPPWNRMPVPPRSMRLLNLVEDDLARQDVAFLMAHRPVEGAEAAVFGAEVGVVDVAVDDVGDDAIGMMLPANGVGLHADADQVVGLEHIDGFSAGNHSGTFILAVYNRGRGESDRSSDSCVARRPRRQRR